MSVFRFWGTPGWTWPKCIHVIPNGADVAAFQSAPPRAACRARLGLGEGFVVGFVGSLKVWHGVDVLLRAFVRLAADDGASRPLIVGTGPAEQHLHQLAGDLGVQQRVVFTGAVPQAAVPALLRAMDVAVAPFRDMEQFYFSPIKLFEYMAAGLCVIASRLGQIDEVIEHGRNGLLCPADDPVALYAVLREAHRSPDLRGRLGAAALETVRQRYTWAHAARAVSEVIRAVVDARSAERQVEALAAVGAPDEVQS